MGEKTWVLDRIEDGEVAVLVGRDVETEVMIPRGWLPDKVREGHVIQVEAAGDGVVSFAIDQDATDATLRRVQGLRASLRKGPSGDIEL